MLHCENVRPDLSAYLDRELPRWKMQLIRWHLYQCPRCSHEMALLQQTDEILHWLPVRAVESDLAHRILQRAEAENRKGVPIWKHSTSTVTRFRYLLRQKALASAFAICLLIGLGITLTQSVMKPKPAAEPEVRVVQVDLIQEQPARGYILY